MSQGTVEQRLNRLEKLVEGVLSQLAAITPRRKDWRRTIGMFDGDPLMAEIIDDALRARDRERQEFYDEYDRDEQER